MAFFSIGKRTLLAGDVKLTAGTGLYKDPSIGDTWYVDATNGNDANAGTTWANAFLTMDEAFDHLASGDRIYFTGKVREPLITPVNVFDVRIVGIGTRHRHADTDPEGSATATATWTTPASGATTAALCKVLQQGWSFENVLFAGPTDHACVWLYRDGSTGDDERDASHAQFVNCRFASGYDGIYDSAGTYNVLVKDCKFEALSNFCILGTGAIGIGQLEWEILDNIFLGFTNGIKIAAFSTIIKNNIFTDGGTPNTTVVVNLSNSVTGTNNFVIGNFFQTATANFNTPDVVGNATDVWAVNASIDSTSAGVGGNFEWGQPA